jgi:uncharacterized repeat protein (TIGR03803 family)
VLDASGNLYGVTQLGGLGHERQHHCSRSPYSGCGTVYELSPSGAETILYTFCQQTERKNFCVDGAEPLGTLVRGKSGNIYGTTIAGGPHKNDGEVFELDTDGNEKVLYAFCSLANCADGAEPYSGVIKDNRENMYGTTIVGGAGGGTIFKLTPNGAEKVLYSFKGGNDGEVPYAPLIEDSTGNFYGTTLMGGNGDGQEDGCCGTVFKLSTTRTETILHAFTGSPDGADPFYGEGLVMDTSGNLYGATVEGGTGDCPPFVNSSPGCGTVYEISTDGTESVLHSFTAGTDGSYPKGSLVRDNFGTLYGTTLSGGSSNCGVVFALASDGTETLLHTFMGGEKDGCAPSSGLVAGKGGTFYGTTFTGGSANYGIVYSIRK